MTDDTTDVTVSDAESDADFGAGFSGEPAERPPGKEKTEPAETPRVTEEPAQEHVKITAKEWAEVRAAAARTASYDSQFSRAFGTLGNLQKLVNESKAQAPAPGRKIQISPTAFAEMEKDFPELAQQTRAALEAALSGVHAPGAADVDVGKLKDTLRQRELEILEEDHPDWATIVGKVEGPDDKPDPDNAFRKWLGTKDAAYQTRINQTISPPVIARAIRLFQSEAKAAKAPATPRTDARAERIKAAVQPRGDGAGAASGGNADMDAFNEGFHSR